MKELFFLALFVVSLAVPVTATELNEDTLNEPVSFGDTSVLVDPSDPAVTQDPVSIRRRLRKMKRLILLLLLLLTFLVGITLSVIAIWAMI